MVIITGEGKKWFGYRRGEEDAMVWLQERVGRYSGLVTRKGKEGAVVWLQERGGRCSGLVTGEGRKVQWFGYKRG